MKRRPAIVALTLALAAAFAGRADAGQITLPIYIEDNHGGSFYWLAEHLDLDEPVTLIHFDAHSDASAIFDSDLLRTKLRRVGSKTERAELLERWREKGAVQCFNWIEPLMPAPFAQVIWVAGEHLEAETQHRESTEAGKLIDGHREAAPRVSGDLRERYRALGFEQLRADFKDGAPLVVSIDLDIFAEVPPGERAAAFERIWSWVCERRNLRAVTFAISRPYLASDADADALLRLAVEGSLSLPTARIYFEPFQRVANDQSLRAREYRARGMEVPAFDVARSSEELRALLLANAERISVRTQRTRWSELVETWAKEAPSLRLTVKDHQPSTDGIWRVATDRSAEIELKTQPWFAAVDDVQWIVQQPVYPRCNLTSTRSDEVGFAEGAPPRPRWREIALGHTEKTLAIDQLAQFFDAQTGCGALRIKARARSGNHIRETLVIELRRFRGSGFRAALTEQFGLPYLFGSGLLRDAQNNTGSDTGWGADCANFMIYALRRQGMRLPWSDPKQLRKHLQLVASDVPLRAGAVVQPDDLENGLFVHLGTHIAAVMEDRAPLGLLGPNDVVAHQLEGAPELIELGELLQQRGRTQFDLLRVPPTPHRRDVLIGGDVMLGRSIGERIARGGDPFAGIADLLRGAEVNVANLECVVSGKGSPAANRRYHLRAPERAATALKRAGFDVVGLANNHASDFGSHALLDSIGRLRRAGVGAIGAGRTSRAAYAPRVVATSSGTRIALLAINDVGPELDWRDAAVASSSDRAALREAIATARAQSDCVIALVHWGDENTAVVTERQRELARWLVEAGVNAIAGSHPHVVQPLDFYRGRPIAYSLGNLVFDGAPTVPAWNRGALMEIDLTGPRSARLIPVQLDERGFPNPAVEMASHAVAGSN